MTFIVILILSVVLLFGFVVFFGAPFLPTLNKQQQTALDLLDLKPGQTLVELGSGDGRMLKAAADRGLKAVGYELNPLLVIYSKIVLYRYKDKVTIKLANFWVTKLPECDGIYVFLLGRYMEKLHKKITQEISGSVKLVSFAFKLPNKEPLTEKDGLYLYNINNNIDKK